MLKIAPSLAEQVYEAVRDEICDGILPPGAPLVQEQLAERFGVSRQPIQQAIALLKADGLIEEHGKRGMRIPFLDLERMRHHYVIRAALDALAAKLAASRVAADAATARLVAEKGAEILRNGNRAVAERDMLGQIRNDAAFHALIYEASGNPLLAATAEPHWRFLRRVMSDVLRHAEPPKAIWEQHAAILEAIRAGDAIRAETLARAHIDVAAEALADAFDAGKK